MAVTLGKLNNILHEVDRFTVKVHDAKIALNTESARQYTGTCPKETGAVRRASMDLTRALVQLRK